jgi:hypothetical protein
MYTFVPPSGTNIISKRTIFLPSFRSNSDTLQIIPPKVTSFYLIRNPISTPISSRKYSRENHRSIRYHINKYNHVFSKSKYSNFLQQRVIHPSHKNSSVKKRNIPKRLMKGPLLQKNKTTPFPISSSYKPRTKYDPIVFDKRFHRKPSAIAPYLHKSGFIENASIVRANLPETYLFKLLPSFLPPTHAQVIRMQQITKPNHISSKRIQVNPLFPSAKYIKMKQIPNILPSQYTKFPYMIRPHIRKGSTPLPVGQKIILPSQYTKFPYMIQPHIRKGSTPLPVGQKIILPLQYTKSPYMTQPHIRKGSTPLPVVQKFILPSIFKKKVRFSNDVELPHRFPKRTGEDPLRLDLQIYREAHPITELAEQKCAFRIQPIKRLYTEHSTGDRERYTYQMDRTHIYNSTNIHTPETPSLQYVQANIQKHEYIPSVRMASTTMDIPFQHESIMYSKNKEMQEMKIRGTQTERVPFQRIHTSQIQDEDLQKTTLENPRYSYMENVD